MNRLPILILLPTGRCNSRCRMCDCWRDRRAARLAPEAVRAWLPEWRELGVEEVVLSGGEPLLHPRLWELCDPIQRAGIGVTLLTNGLLLRRHAGAAAGCRRVIVSLDGPAAVHDRIRGLAGAHRRLAEGVAALRRAGPAVRIEARCTVQRANCRHLAATVGAARSLGLDRISFLAADVHSPAFHREGGWPARRRQAVAPRRADREALAAAIDRLAAIHAADFVAGFIAESPDRLRQRVLGYFRARAGETADAPVRCNAPRVSAVIESDGTVRPCFFLPPLGRLDASGRLGAILDSPDARAWRDAWHPADEPLCRGCVCTLDWRG